MDSDDDDEEPQNEPGTSSSSQPSAPVLPLNQGPAASSQGPAASAYSDDENSEFCDEDSARSQVSGRTLLHPDLHTLTNDEHWKVTPETHTSMQLLPGHSVFVTTENGEQQVNFLTPMPSVQRSLCLKKVTDNSSSTRVEIPHGVDNQTSNVLERCMATCGKAAKRSVSQEVRGYHKQFAEAKHIEWKSWIDNEVFDLVDLRKFKPKKYVTSRWALTIETDKQGNLRAKARWVLRRIQDKQKEYLQTDSPALLDHDFG